ncbi:MAG: hypothetical protein JO340_04040 [Acidobacteriaceae bacterium]|nr:hypothetical protein [Acidobacteriaceae bacterium]
MEVRKRRAACILTACILAGSTIAFSGTLADDARGKLQHITARRTAPGSTVIFSGEEVAAWVAEEQQSADIAGIRDLAVSFGENAVLFDCKVDLVALSASFHQPLDPFSAMFVAGEHSLHIGIAVHSEQERAMVSLAEFGYDGPAVPIVRQRLVSGFLAAYPAVRFDQPFTLGYNIQQVSVDATGVRVLIMPRAGNSDLQPEARAAVSATPRPAAPRARAVASPGRSIDAGPNASPNNRNPQQPNASAATPPLPSISEQELNSANDAMIKMQGRAEAVNQALGGLQRQQAAAGYGLRGDMAAASARMNSYLRMAEQQIRERNPAGAQANMDHAEPDLEKLEKFLGL